MIKNYFCHTICAISACATVLLFQACGGNQTEALQSELDSLMTIVEQQNQDLEFYQSCLFLVSDGLDSIARADNNLVAVASNKEKTVTRESIKQDLDAYASLLTRQRERINTLERQMTEGNKDRERMRGIINMLKQQVEEKDATIQKLQEKIETKDFNIALLLDEINLLHAKIADRDQKIADRDQKIKKGEEALDVAREMINEAYYLIGTSKELKESGVLKGKFFGKSKVNVDEIKSSKFTQIDIRNFNKLVVDSKKITLKSQHPSTSYEIQTDKKNGISTLVILDENAFWDQTRYLIIQK